MRALVFKNGQLRYLTDYPLPLPAKNEALIKVIRAGICNTDLEITKGYTGFQGVLGHEFVGIVEKCSIKKLLGKRVAGEINIGCGICPYCKRHMQNHCPRRSVLGILNKDGVFADYVTLPAGNLHEIPDSVSDEEAVFTEPLAAAFEITHQIKIMTDDRVCVLGDGKLGLLAGQVLSLTACDLIVVGKHKEKLSVLEKRGIKTRLISKFKEKEFDIVVDCTGSPSGIAAALSIVKPGGKIILKTTMAKNKSIDLNKIVVNELTLIGSRCGPFAPAIKALEKKKLDVSSLLGKRYSLRDGIAAFRHALRKGVLKVVLEIS